MVTVAQARTQLTQQTQALQQRRQQIQRAVIPSLSPTQLRQRGRAGLIQQQTQSRELESRKKQALQQLKPLEQQLGKFETQLRPIEQQIKQQKQFNTDIRRATKFVDDNRFPIGESKQVRRLFSEISSGRKSQKQFKQTIEELEAKGIKPIFIGGKAVGFEDFITQQSVQLDKIIPQFTPLPKSDIVFPGAKPTTLELPEKTLTGDLRAKQLNLERQFEKETNPFKQQAIQAKLAAIGIGVTLVSTAKAVVSPVETAKGLGKLGVETTKFLTSPVGTVATPLAIVGKTLRTSPGFSTGVGATLVLPFLKGTSIIKGGKGVKGKAKFTTEDFNTIVIIGGKGKDTIVRNIVNLNNDFRILNDQGKITNTIAYTIKTADGRKFEVLEFSKATGSDLTKGLVGKREILAFEIKRTGKPGEVLVGRAAERLTSTGGESFVDLIRFKTSFGGAERIQVLQKTIIESSKTIGGIQKISLKTEAGIVKISNVDRNLRRNTSRFIKELNKGKSIERVLGRNLGKLRTLINIERRLKGEKVFTKAEFEAAFSKTLTKTELIIILDKISLTGLVKTPFGATGLRLVGKRKFGIAGGSDIKKLPEPFAKLVKKTLLKKTFAKEKVPIIRPRITKLKDKFGRFRESRLVTRDKKRGDKDIELQSPKPFPRTPSRDPFPQPEILQLPPSTVAPAISLALERPLTSFGSPVRLVTRTATGVRSTVALIPSTKLISSLRLRINQLQKNKQELLQIPKQEQTQFTQSRLTQLQRNIQLQQLRLTQLQKLKQIQRTTSRIQIAPIIPLIPIIPKIPIVPKISKGVGKKKRLVEPFKPKGKGYNTFVKSKAKFMKVNIRPITKNKARDLGAFITDQSLSATFKIVKTKKNAKVPKIKFPRDYFGLTKDKYRSPIRKGKKVPVKDLFIEKRKHRLDTLRETKKIQAARLISQLRKNAFKRSKPFKFKRV